MATPTDTGRDRPSDPASSRPRRRASVADARRGGGPHAAGASGRDRDMVAGVQPAGRVLVVMVLALILGLLINADDLTERAEQRPLGPSRDRALAVWRPARDVSHVLQLHRIRQLADAVLGDETGVDAEIDGATPPRPSPEPQPADPAATPDAAEATPPTTELALREASAKDPLHLWVAGDSMAQVFGESLTAMAADRDVVDATLHYEISSGLTRPDYYDWPRALARDTERTDPEVVVVVFGANDAQGIVLDDGTPVQEMSDPRWAAEYSHRVAAVMDQLARPGRLIVWVGPPPMREPGFNSRMALIDDIFESEAATRPWVAHLDAGSVLADGQGGYADLVPNTAGDLVRVRRPDGIHLTRQGGDLLAMAVLDLVDRYSAGTAADGDIPD